MQFDLALKLTTTEQWLCYLFKQTKAVPFCLLFRFSSCDFILIANFAFWFSRVFTRLQKRKASLQTLKNFSLKSEDKAELQSVLGWSDKTVPSDHCYSSYTFLLLIVMLCRFIC